MVRSPGASRTTWASQILSNIVFGMVLSSRLRFTAKMVLPFHPFGNMHDPIEVIAFCYTTRMELHHLRYFVAVAERLSFSRAAEDLDLAQPSLSRQIRDLERELNAPLFNREGRRISLTAAGAA